MSKSYVSASTGIAEDWRCATNKLNEVVCWGNNAWNNLGNQEFTDKMLKIGKYSEEHENDLMYLKDNYTSEPVNVLVKNPYKSLADDPDYVKLSGVTKVMTGNAHGCAITIDGEVYCWGSNSSGQLGLGSDEYKTENMNVGYASKVVTGEQGAKSGHLSHVVDLSLGVDHSCALTVEGDIYCWGDNTAMELGDSFEKQSVRPIFTVEDCNGDITDKIKIVTDPVKVPAGDVKFSSISKTGSWAHCALSTEETTTDDEGHNLWCWGNDVGGIVTNDNKEYLLELKNKNGDRFFNGEKCQSLDYSDIAGKSSLWYYTKGGEAVWPMFGKPITNVKSVKSQDKSPRICNTASLETENPDCFKVYSCDNVLYKPTESSYAKLVKSDQTCVNTIEIKIEIKNVAAVDINGKGTVDEDFEPDSQIHFTTSDAGNVLFTAKTNPGSEEDNPKSRIDTIPLLYGENLFEEGEKIKEIRASSKYNVFVVSDKNKLYGVGISPFGMVEDAAPDNENRFAIHFDDMVQEVSVNQRSVCALVSGENSDSNMWCWGSKTFGQLGLEYQSNPAYSFGDVQNAWKLDNVYILNQYYYADDSMLDRPTMSGVEIQ